MQFAAIHGLLPLATLFRAADRGDAGGAPDVDPPEYPQCVCRPAPNEPAARPLWSSGIVACSGSRNACDIEAVRCFVGWGSAMMVRGSVRGSKTMGRPIASWSDRNSHYFGLSSSWLPPPCLIDEEDDAHDAAMPLPVMALKVRRSLIFCLDMLLLCYGIAALPLHAQRRQPTTEVG